MNNIINTVPYLRTTREFPEEIKLLTVEANKAYVDTANAINVRTIGLYPTSRPALTGESYFLQGNRKQQTSRQVYNFTTTADIPIGFKASSVDFFAPSEGKYTDGLTGWFGVIQTSSTAIAGQLGYFIFIDAGSTTTDLIRFTVGAGSPPVSKGFIELRWISNP